MTVVRDRRLVALLLLRRAVPLYLMTALVPLATLAAQATSTSVHYRVTSTSVLSLDRAAQTPLVDTVTTSSLLTIAISRATDTIASLSIDSLQVSSTGLVRRAPDAFTHGISVSAVLSDGRPKLTGDSASSCAAERPLAGLLPELLPLLPTPLSAEQQWSDTLTVTTCRAGLSVTTITIATYRTLSGMDSTSMLLERRAVTRAMGSAVIRDQTVTLTGTGTSESLGVVLLAARRLQSWRGAQSLEFEITNGQQTRRMVQQVAETATMLP